ncbi:MAG: hypothetical protein FJY07_11565 [Bacteroidetes bacterium]|nr:hypothetical protein [Bacteroidota bacterium]
MIRRFTTYGSYLTEGKTFQNVSPEIVIDFLRTRKIDYHYVVPCNLQILNIENKLFIKIIKEHHLLFPMRRSFFEKLLMWYKIPFNFAYQADLDVSVSLMNNILKLIKRNYIRVVIEDGQAITLTSPDYVDIHDLDIIEKHTKNELLKITRTDMFTKLDLVEAKTINPLPGDTCGLGLSVFNSETGFYNFTVKVYLLRYICSNGAILNSDVLHEKIPHYNARISGEAVQSSINRQLDLINNKYDLIKSRFETASGLKISVEKLKGVIEKIDIILGYKKGGYFLGDLQSKENSTLFDLFNFITDKAKQYEPNIRLRLEETAGEIILN